jgi:sugar phosphate isomerase/epimerase
MEEAGKHFANSELLIYALNKADEQNIDLYLENEPVCKVHTKSDILDLLKHNAHPRLRLWLDVANLIEIGENLDAEFVKSVIRRLGYVHVKDFIKTDGEKTYVPVGKGQIAYDKVIHLLSRKNQNDIVITVETHAKTDKMRMSEQSIIGLRQILDNQGVAYQQ